MRNVTCLLTFLIGSSLLAADTPPAPVFRAVRATTPPVIDGNLDDPAWQSAPEITGFTQHDPDDGKPATQKTVVKVVYDEQAIYIGARMEDTKAVTTLLGRRDNNLESDWFRIYVDAQHDRLTGAVFWVNPSNVQLDKALYSDIYSDSSWDAVWQSEARIVPGGWVVEVKIPYSQLRFPDRPEHIWGINFARKIVSRNEDDWLVNTPKGQSGTVSRFADLAGITGIHPARTFEVMPYGVARSDLQSKVPAGDPFTRPTDYKMDGGVDLKYGLTSNLTLTGTINPDFGQVEVDPAVLNLSQFETFFPEKRPFFTEGASIFSFGTGPANFRASFNFFPPNFFYSRRIGRSPQGTSNVRADYIEAPTETTILGAAKITGKIGKGWSIGVLDVLTDRERARYELSNSRFSQQVEPMSNYLVARTSKEYGNNSKVGVLFTGVTRRLPNELSFMRKSAATLGVDGYTKFHKNDWLWEWLVGQTRVSGSKQSIAATQRSPAHRFARPDADHLHYDPNRTSLSGTGWRTMIGKQTGRWRPIFATSGYTPGFEVNDVGFMQRADTITSHFVIKYENETVTRRVRSREFWIAKFQNWNFGRDLLANGLYGNWSVEMTNYWYVFGWEGMTGRALDDRKTRGGPLAVRASGWNGGIGMGSDSRKRVSFEASVETSRSSDSSWEKGVSVSAVYRPTTNLKLQLSPSFTREYDYAQYVTTIPDRRATATYGAHYVFAGIDQNIFELGTRADWTINSKLSLQLYLQPFVAAGDYHDFRELARPRSGEYVPFAYDQNPDFNFRSLRASAVVRWEFRPGSSLYVVWNENRAASEPFGDFRMRRDISSLREAPSRDIFLVKVSYWLPM
jgi:hypothetical protein